MSEEQLSTVQVAALLGVTRQRVAKLILDGKIKASKGRYGAYLVDRSEALRFLSLERGHGRSTPDA